MPIVDMPEEMADAYSEKSAPLRDAILEKLHAHNDSQYEGMIANATGLALLKMFTPLLTLQDVLTVMTAKLDLVDNHLGWKCKEDPELAPMDPRLFPKLQDDSLAFINWVHEQINGQDVNIAINVPCALISEYYLMDRMRGVSKSWLRDMLLRNFVEIYK